MRILLHRLGTKVVLFYLHQHSIRILVRGYTDIYPSYIVYYHKLATYPARQSPKMKFLVQLRPPVRIWHFTMDNGPHSFHLAPLPLACPISCTFGRSVTALLNYGPIVCGFQSIYWFHIGRSTSRKDKNFRNETSRLYSTGVERLNLNQGLSVSQTDRSMLTHLETNNRVYLQYLFSQLQTR